MDDITGREQGAIEFHESEALLLECQRLGRTGYIIVDFVAERVVWSDTVFDIRRVPRRPSFTFDESIDFIHPEDRPKYIAARRAATDEHRDFELDVRIRRGDGSIGWEHSRGHPRYDEGGQLVSVLVVLRDVTEEKEAEIALRESQALLLECQRLGKTGYALSDFTTGRVYWSETLFEMRRVPHRPYFTLEESLAFIHPEDLREYLPARNAALAEGRTIEREARTIRGDGTIGWEHGIGHPRFDGAGNLTGLLIVLRDITEDKTGALALRESRELLVESQRIGKTGYILFDLAADRVYWSESLFELRRVPPRPYFTLEENAAFIHPDDLPGLVAARMAAIDARRPYETNLRFLRGDGTIGWERGIGHPRFDEAGNLTVVLVVVRDVTEEKAAETALRENQALLLESQRIGKTGYILTDLPTGRVYWSETVFEMRRVPRRPYFTVEESIAFLHPDDAQRFRPIRQAAVERGQPYELEVRTLRGDGSIGWEVGKGQPRFDEAGKIKSILIVLRDITEEKQAQNALRESQALLVEAQRLGKTGYMVTDLAQGRVYWSRSLFDMRRMPPRPFLTLEEGTGYIHPDDRARYLAIRDAALASGQRFEADTRIIRGDGSIGWEKAVGLPRLDEAGRPRDLLIWKRDITDEKLAADALAEKDRQLSAIMDNAPVAIFLKDRDGRYLRTNRLFDTITGRAQDFTGGRKAAEIFIDRWSAIASQTDREVLETGKIVTMDAATHSGRDDFAYAAVTKFPVRNDAGEIVGIGGVIANITERHQAETALRQREADLRAVMDNAPLAIFLKDREGRMRFVNRCFADWYCIDASAALGRVSATLFSEPLARWAVESDRQVLEQRQVVTVEYATDDIPHEPGFDVARVTKFPILDDSGNVVGVGGFSENVTARKRAEDALRKSEERFRALIEQSTDLIILLDADGLVHYVSPSISELLGYAVDELVGRSILDILHPDDFEGATEHLRFVAQAAGLMATGQTRVRHKNGAWRIMAWTARNAMDVPGVEGIIVNNRDVTEAKDLQEQLLQAQKMEAMGQLAGGIAHDFNNMLSVILGFARFLLEDVPKESPQHEYAESIAHAADRARDVVRQILAFSRRSSVERSLDDIGRIVLDTCGLLRASLPASVRFDVQVEADGLIGNVNKGEIHQILQNLCVNAGDALGGQPGDVTIAVGKIVPGDPDYRLFEAPQFHGLAAPTGGGAQVTVGALDRATPYARVAVSDTGSGIPADVMRRLFEPFFTTKQRGRGTGLGLAVVHGIVASYGGACRVESRLGEGTHFVVYLPLSRDARRVEPSAAKGPDVRGDERVLVIDDERDVADVLVIGLGRLGYRVAAFNDPVAAVAAFERTPDAWDVVICDQVMPRLDGFAVYARLKEIRPALRFILCTGFAAAAAEEHAAEIGIDGFFIKPVSPDRLAQCMRTLFSAPLTAQA